MSSTGSRGVKEMKALMDDVRHMKRSHVPELRDKMTWEEEFGSEIGSLVSATSSTHHNKKSSSSSSRRPSSSQMKKRVLAIKAPSTSSSPRRHVTSKRSVSHHHHHVSHPHSRELLEMADMMADLKHMKSWNKAEAAEILRPDTVMYADEFADEIGSLVSASGGKTRSRSSLHQQQAMDMPVKRRKVSNKSELSTVYEDGESSVGSHGKLILGSVV